MRKTAFTCVVLILVTAAIWGLKALYDAEGRMANDPEARVASGNSGSTDEREAKEQPRRPNEWFLEQRAYPGHSIPQDQYTKSQTEARALRAAVVQNAATPIWSLAGPTNIPGRVSTLAVHPSQPNTIYAGAAAGGLFKSTNLGGSWSPIFDAVGTYAIGSIAIRPDNPSVLFVGTGEATVAIDMYEGVGIYKSSDAGATWSFLGLPNSGVIGKMIIDPLRPDTMYAAVLGRTFGFRFGTNKSTERGVYRSIDAGTTWQRVLYLNDSTGCIDVALHPSTGTLFAALYYPYNSSDNAIWKSSNNGDTWTLISGTGGLPTSPDMSRIGLTVDPSSNTVYALHIDNVTSNLYGLYKSTDLGVNWTQTNDAAIASSYGGFGWYFGQVRVAPGNPNIVYSLGQTLWKSDNGGGSWFEVTNFTHVDFHDLYILPSNPNVVYSGCDGGVNYSSNGGASWSTFFNMPTTQFYAATVDFNDPTHIYGGSQDNNTLRTMTGGTGDWSSIWGGDGFYSAVDYTNSNIIYAESQNGYIVKSTDNAANFSWAQNGISPSEPHAWNTPLIMDPNTPATLYTSTDRVYKTTDGALNWTAISPSLTTRYLTTIGVAKSDPGVVYAGSRTGTVFVTQNSGGSWTDIGGPLPDRWITRLTVDPVFAGICYVTLSGYISHGEKAAHIYRTGNYGSTWTDITNNLPNSPVNDVIIDPLNLSTLYVATDVGVYETKNVGGVWAPLGTGMPITCVHDLEMNSASRQIIAATHGRSMYKSTLPCCFGTTGNADGDLNDVVDISDVFAVVDFLQQSIPLSNCPDENDVNKDGPVDISDVFALVDYLSLSSALPLCP